MKKRWHIKQPDPDAVAHIRQYLNCGPVTAAVLVNRNICTDVITSYSIHYTKLYDCNIIISNLLLLKGSGNI